jgi:hypothetical protein
VRDRGGFTPTLLQSASLCPWCDDRRPSHSSCANRATKATETTWPQRPQRTLCLDRFP